MSDKNQQGGMHHPSKMEKPPRLSPTPRFPAELKPAEPVQIADPDIFGSSRHADANAKRPFYGPED